MLEPSAGYCNDRSLYNSSNELQGDSVSLPQYATSSDEYRYGAYVRNVTTSQLPSLGCPRATVDLYTTSAASNGNKQLSKPVAMLTLDEASFAGTGSATPANGSAYHLNSYLRSGSNTWLLSPNGITTDGIVQGSGLNGSTGIGNGNVSASLYVRPAISLNPGVIPSSGSGTAADPWVISAP